MDSMEGGGGTPSASGNRPVLPAISPAPSTTTAGNRPTSASTSQLTPSTSSGPPTGPPSGPPTSQVVSKRKRGLGLVTPTACTECRKKRAKCDGEKPCGRCKYQNTACVYEQPVRQSKDTLRNEIEQLKREQRNHEHVINALRRTDKWDDVLQRLRNGQSIDMISSWLEGTLPSGGGTLPSIDRLVGSAPGTFNFSGDLAGTYGGAIPGWAPISRFPGQQLPGQYPTSPPQLSQYQPSQYQLTQGHPGHLQRAIRHEVEPHSPWSGQFSSHSQTVRSNSLSEAMSWASESGQQSQSRAEAWADARADANSENQRFRGFDQVLATEAPHSRAPPITWTTITSDNSLVQHLLALYFCWEYPTFASLSKEHFLKDFMDGRPRFCSSLLVNALLALGCRFSSQPSTRENPNDPYSSGDHFFKECQRLFYQEENHHTLTTIQALGIMSIREASCGRDSESWFYAGQSIRLAIEMGLHRVQDDGKDCDESAVQAATFWGAFALDHAWSLATGSLPQCSCFPQLPPKPAIIDDIEASLWIPYTDDGKNLSFLDVVLGGRDRLINGTGAPLRQSCEQPSNVRSVYKCFCELSELVHQSLYILHSPGRPLTSRDLLKIYTQYLNWYDRIPEVLRLGHNFTPAVLFAHMYYHFAILLLFRPLIKLRIVGSSISPRDVCVQAADAISGLLRSYSQLYTLRRTPSFVPYFVLTSSIMHLAIGATASAASDPAGGTGQAGLREHGHHRLDPRIAEAISRGIADLTEMAPCHHFAEQALNILKYLAKKWNIDVDVKTTGGEDETQKVKIDSYQTTRPVTSSLNFFVPNVTEEDFNCTWGEGIKPGHVSTRQVEVQPGNIKHMAKTTDNPLFWPFPMQGRPILGTGPELLEAGFELI
ncbi:fungal-specific transcription factor domain-containing protein [Pseudoneurospora amorphoporcata]|uniref:Fungal-specific transcription factor domain-containing protein n=1 Tax=Pseudoneurospora amorphoporcata TaxID=241081 RepID=A0AAN6NKX4_9PEZI|nr:fungal-specific transcription factor domain-containing protein [Pseudoneurospora amorphoporcata]